MSDRPPRAAYVKALGSLTLRGRCLVAAGLACATSGVFIGAQDLVRAGALVVVLPVLAALALARRHNRLSCSRSVLPPTVRPGDACTIVVRVSNHARRATPSLVLTDEMAPMLGAPPRFRLDPIPAGAIRNLVYEVRPHARGVHSLGPLTCESTDPFGCSSRRARLEGTALVTVTPVVVPLPTITLPGVSLDGDERTGVVPTAGADDVAVREYHVGDDVRRVNWRATARAGELMVRREEHERRPPATLILDSRRCAFGLAAGESSSPAFEWAVSVTASVGAHLLASERPVRLVHADGRAHVLRTSQSTAALLVGLAGLAPADTPTLAAAAAAAPASGWVLAILGNVGDADAAYLCRLPGGVGRQVRVAVLTAGARVPRPHPGTVSRLRQAGWTVVWGAPGLPFAPLWVSLDAGGPVRALQESAVPESAQQGSGAHRPVAPAWTSAR